MSQATILGKHYTLPGHWNELQSRAQLVQVVELLHARREVPDLQLRLVLVLLRAKWQPLLSWRLMQLKEEWAAELLPLSEFLLGPSLLTRQLLPRLRPRWWAPVLHGPPDRLAKGDLTEWIEAEAAYYEYYKTKDEAHLNTLIAVLYRPRRRQKPSKAEDDNGDVREVLNLNTVAGRAAQIARLPRAVRLAVLTFYDGCRRRIVGQYEETIFDGESGSKPQHPRHVFLTIAAELATTPDRLDAIVRQPRSIIFFDLDRRIRQNREREAEAEAARRR